MSINTLSDSNFPSQATIDYYARDRKTYEGKEEEKPKSDEKSVQKVSKLDRFQEIAKKI